MRSFSKKLAFVLAAAMVVTAFAPAASAKAADEMAINAQGKILYVTDGTGINDAAQVGGGKGNVAEYDFAVSNKPANWKTDYTFTWSSSNDKVITVANGGLTKAVAVGTADVVCVVTEKATGDSTVLKNTVTVKANAAEVALKDDSKDGATVVVGDVVDLDRVMTDAKGNETTKRGTFVTDYTRWVAEPATGVTINQKNGQFTFTADAVAGDYKLYCETYQSKKYTDATATSDAVVVTLVKAEEVEINQVDLDTFEVVFGSDVTAADVSVALVMNIMGQDYKLPVAIANPVVKDNKATVELFSEVNDKDKYVFTVNGKEYDVVAHAGDAASFKVSTDATKGADYAFVTAGATDVKLAVTLYDADGVDVTKKYENTDAYVEFVEVVPSEEGKYYVSVDGEIWFEEANKSVLVDVTFHTNKYAEDSDVELGVLTDRFAFISIAAPTTSLEGVQAATIKNAANEDTKKLELPLGTEGSYLEIKPIITGKKADEVAALVNGEAVTVAGVDYTITVDGLADEYFGIDVDGTNGMGIVPFQVGSGKVVFYAQAPEKNPVAIGMIEIKVTKAIALDKVYLEKNSVTVGNVDGLDTAEIAVKADDNYGNAWTGSIGDVTITASNAAAKKVTSENAVVYNEGKIYIDGSEFEPAFANEKATSVTLEYKVKLNNKDNTLTITVKRPTATNATYNIEKTAGDWGDVTRLAGEKTAAAKSITFEMFKLSNSIKVGGVVANPYVDKKDLTEADINQYFVKVSKGAEDITNKAGLVVLETVDVTSGSAATTVTINFSSIKDGFVSYDGTGAGNYTVTLYQAYKAGNSVAYRTLKTVTGTTTVDQGKYTYVGIAKDTADSVDFADLRACFKINGRDGKEATADVANVNFKESGDVAFVYDITFNESVGDASVAYKVTVNKSVKVK
jgi:class 3 adenylate cyclase